MINSIFIWWQWILALNFKQYLFEARNVSFQITWKQNADLPNSPACQIRSDLQAVYLLRIEAEAAERGLQAVDGFPRLDARHETTPHPCRIEKIISDQAHLPAAFTLQSQRKEIMPHQSPYALVLNSIVYSHSDCKMVAPTQSTLVARQSTDGHNE